MATLIDLVGSDFWMIFGQGFVAGFLIASFIMGIRAAISLFVKIIKS